MTDSHSDEKICEGFVRRIIRDRVGNNDLNPDELRNVCRKCLKRRNIRLPDGYADLGALGVCSICDATDECVDPAVLWRYAEAGIDPNVVYLSMPRLRRPFGARPIHISVIEAVICAYLGGSKDD